MSPDEKNYKKKFWNGIPIWANHYYKNVGLLAPWYLYVGKFS